MRSPFSYACLVMPVAVHLILVPSPGSAVAIRRCGSIYRGFAQCLLALGDSITKTVQREEDTQEIDTVCRSWDEFHTCANLALAGCPDEAAMVWESLRQESKKTQFSGNLYDMCANRAAQPAPSLRTPPSQRETNQESLKSHAHHTGSTYLVLFSACLLSLWLTWQKI